LEALEMLMKAYEGTIIFVTHDRSLISHVANRIFHLESGQLTVFDGTYDDYLERKNHQTHDTSKQELLLLETKISDVLSRLSIEPTAELEAEFERLLVEKKGMEGE